MCSKCEHLKFYRRINGMETNPWELIAEIDPDREEFQHLKYGPFVLDRMEVKEQHRHTWDDLRIDGYLGERSLRPGHSLERVLIRSLRCSQMTPRSMPTERTRHEW